MRRHPQAVFLVLLALALPFVPARPAAAAQLTVFDAVDSTFAPGYDVHKNQDLGQSFTASTDYRVLRVDVLVHDADPGIPMDLLTLSIQTDLAGLPSGVVLTNGTVDGPFGYTWLSIDLASPIDLVAGQTYWIVLDNAMNPQSGYNWAVNTDVPYLGGTAAGRSGTGGSWVRLTGEDFEFRAWGLKGPLVVAGLAVDSATAGVWDPVQFTVFFNNTGTEPAPLVWTNLTLSQNLTYVSDTASAAGGLSTGPTSWMFSDVPVGPHGFVVNALVGDRVFDGLRLETAVTVAYEDAGLVAAPGRANATVVVHAPSLSLLKDATPKFLGPDENLTYRITVVNSGSRPAPWAWVNDTLPSEVQYVGTDAGSLANVTGVWWDGATLRVNFTALPQGSYGFDVFVRTRPGLLNGTAFTNSVTAAFTDSRGILVPATASASATARIHGASVRVVKTADVATVGAGQEITYRIRYDNRGNATARNAWINDTLPPEVDYVSDSGGGVLTGSALRFSFADVPVGVRGITIVVRVKAGVPDGTLTENLVTLEYTDSDYALLAPSTSRADVLVVAPRLALFLGGDATADPGDLWALDVRLVNEGRAPAAAAWLNLTVPPELTRVSDNATTQGGTATPTGWTFADVAPGTVRFTVSFRVAIGLGDGRNLSVAATADFVDGYGARGGTSPAVRDVAVVAPSFRLSTTLVRPIVEVGEPFDLLVRYTNAGNGTASDVWINVTFPAGSSVVSASDPWIATTGLRYIWHLRSVTPGTEELRVTLRLNTNDPERSIVTAVLEYTDANGNSAGAELAASTIRAVSAGASAQTWMFLSLLAVVGGLAAFIGYRVYGVGKGHRAQIHQLFLLHKSGLLIKHYSRSLRADLDSDILAAMIVAVQNFVRETFRFGPGDLEEMKYGEHNILLVHGHNAILAALVSGHYLDRMKSVLRQSVARVEEEYAPQLRDWTGMMSDLRGIDGLFNQVLQGKVPNTNGRNGHGNPRSPP